MADTGFVIAGTGAGVARTGSTDNWADVTNITASDNADATCNLFSAADKSNYLKGTNYGHAIPTGATIDGVEVQYEGNQNVNNRADNNSTLLVKAGTISGTDKGDGRNFGFGDSLEVFGGAADLWGLTLSEADVELSTFGFVISGDQVTSSVQIQCDAMWTKIFYTAAGGGGLSINVSDSITVAESVTLKFNPMLVNVSDSVTVAESVALRFNPLLIAVNDAIVVVESVALTFSDLRIAVSDGITVGESVKMNMLIFPSVSEGITVADVVKMNLLLMPNVSDSITVGESVRVHVLILISVNDAISVADSPTVSIVSVSALSINVSDSVTVGESVSVTGPSAVASTESFVGEKWKASVARRNK